MATSNEIDIIHYKSLIIRFCNYQERCISEVKQKLKSFALPEEMIQSIVPFLIENNFVNEVRYAYTIIRGRTTIKRWGKKKIIEYLRAKSISDEIINKAFDEFEKEMNTLFEENLITLGRKKWEKLKVESVKGKVNKNKLIAYLMSKGYEYDMIVEFLPQIAS